MAVYGFGEGFRWVPFAVRVGGGEGDDALRVLLGEMTVFGVYALAEAFGLAFVGVGGGGEGGDGAGGGGGRR